MVIYLTKIEAHETKFTVETRYHDIELWDFFSSPEKAVEEGRRQVQLINFFRNQNE